MVPVYYRISLKKRFKPISGCDGDCLSCARGLQQPICGKPFLMEADAMTLSKYLRLKPDRGLCPV